MSHNNAYFVCLNHGNVYVLRDVTMFSHMKYELLEPMIDGVELPNGGDKVKCPLCEGDFRIFFGD